MTDRPRPQSRYGRPGLSAAARRRVVVALAALTVAATAALATVAYQRLHSSDVDGSLAAYRVLDDETVSVTISVTRADPAQPVDCIVRVRSEDGSETGRREVLVAPSDQKTVQVTTTLASSKPAVVGDIYGCGADVPDYLQAP
jgi:hypothetical protein